MLEAINTGVIPEGWNTTTIVLIPKVDNPEKVSQFRPISLCNVVYKVISKVLVARFKVFLPEIISETQSAFVPGRIITDNVIVAYECLHTMKKKKTRKVGNCAIKLDMHKDYDRVEWVFLNAILRKLGFDGRWVDLIMTCVTSVEYKVRFNSNETDPFSPTRGLRQGGPLSPYLFLLCAEGLSALIAHKEERGNLIGVKVCRDSPIISHLLFVDDSLILMKANSANAITLKNILNDYCLASG